MTNGKTSIGRRLARRGIEPALALSWRRLRARSTKADLRATTPGEQQRHDLAAAIISFDGYQRFWPALRHFTKQHLSDSLPRYWISETVPIASAEEGTQVLVGPARFVPRIRRGIEKIPAKYVFLIQEDIWFDRAIDQATLDRLVAVMETHQLDCLKLGWSSFVPDDQALIEASTDELPGDPSFRWFGGNPYSMSQHGSIFRASYFLDTCRLAEQARITDALRHEQFLSTFLEGRAKARNNDDRDVRIAVWNGEPVISYAHAGWQGKLTPEGRELLEANHMIDSYDHSQDGADPPRPR